MDRLSRSPVEHAEPRLQEKVSLRRSLRRDERDENNRHASSLSACCADECGRAGRSRVDHSALRRHDRLHAARAPAGQPEFESKTRRRRGGNLPAGRRSGDESANAQGRQHAGHPTAGKPRRRSERPAEIKNLSPQPGRGRASEGKGGIAAISSRAERPPSSRSPRGRRGEGGRSDHVLAQRRIAVEADRRIGRRIGAGRLDQHLVADGK
jgi:hypothetical protein